MPDYTCAKLVEIIKTRIGNNEYPDEDILDYLNDAQMEILGEARYSFLERRYDYDDIGDGKLAMPTDCQCPIQLIIDNRALEYVPYQRFFESVEPDQFTIFADEVYYRGGGDGFKCVTLLYLAKPLEIDSLEDEPYIPYEFKEILVLGAMARIERADGNYDQAELLRRHQDELLLNMKLRYGPRQQSGSSRMRLPLSGLGRI